jgi:excisionase family DNA binding protein
MFEGSLGDYPTETNARCLALVEVQRRKHRYRPNPALTRLVFRDTVSEALALLTPDELLACALRACHLPDHEIAHRLGISPSAVSLRITTARKRIEDHIPELRLFLSDRAKPPTRDQDPEGLTPAQVADLLGIDPATVRRWCAAGRFPNAVRQGSSWHIPRTDL